jgi:hypothetical protein
MKKLLLLTICASAISIDAGSKDLTTYDDIKDFIKNPQYGEFAPQVNVNRLTPEQRTTLAELAEAHYDNRWTSLIESSRTFHKDDKARKQLPKQYHFRAWEVQSNIEANVQASWKAAKLWEIMAQINPGYCNLRGFICAAAIPLPQPSKQELEDRIRSANLTLEQATKIFAIANKELKTRRERNSKYLNFSDSTISKKSEIATLPDGRRPREVKIEILENIIEIVHPYR